MRGNKGFIHARWKFTSNYINYWTFCFGRKLLDVSRIKEVCFRWKLGALPSWILEKLLAPRPWPVDWILMYDLMCPIIDWSYKKSWSDWKIGILCSMENVYGTKRRSWLSPWKGFYGESNIQILPLFEQKSTNTKVWKSCFEIKLRPT